MIRSIVFAEDDEDEQFYFREVLHEIKPDIHIEFVANGHELLDLLKSYIPDLLFLDLDMPYRNGLECLMEIRKQEAISKLPVVIFSSTNRPANITTAYDTGCDLFVHKSSSYSHYAAQLKQILHLNWKEPTLIRQKHMFKTFEIDLID